MILLLIAIIILLIGIGLLFFILRQKNDLGILANTKPLYQDTTKIPGVVLYAKSLALVGKPDYLLRIDGDIIPVEVKTGRSPRKSYLGHNMQLMAYCLLVEENYGIRPKGGILKYHNKELKLAYTKKAEQSLRKLVAEILNYKQTNKQPHCTHPNHNK